MSSNEGIYKSFLDKAATIAREQGRVPVQWVEMFEHFGRYVYGGGWGVWGVYGG